MNSTVVDIGRKATLDPVHRERQGCGKAQKQFPLFEYITSWHFGQVSCRQAIVSYKEKLTGKSAKTPKMYWYALQEKEGGGHGV